ncbi:HAD-IA family hydrolase [Paenibacillus sp. LHD-117]|uniref:HAD family hydrolase n=1 Tax=Paenibacillus sp. LHD-117 TaxID=3071412 RepID=UPI0027E0F4FF|nr:HAD-IA family hydrolase [Paenibacillus sp. LHD-117]MDQ6419167.1 HAD-IA family hydrolase [Paenibacillus sp. LHD-117]
MENQAANGFASERGIRSSPGGSKSGARPQLVLDIGGVLATNLTPLFWELTAEAAGVDRGSLYGMYKREISEKLWSGVVTEAEFWEWLLRQAPGVGIREGQSFLAESLLPLPALNRLPEWSGYADIHILSNHLVEWVEPVLRPFKPFLKQIIVSSEAGWRKPQPEMFACAAALLPAEAAVLFVDDQPGNLRQAETLGWSVMQADGEGRWTEAVDRWLALGGG